MLDVAITRICKSHLDGNFLWIEFADKFFATLPGDGIERVADAAALNTAKYPDRALAAPVCHGTVRGRILSGGDRA